MAQEERSLIDIEKQNGIDSLDHPSRRSSCNAFAPTNVDNLAKKLRLKANHSKERETKCSNGAGQNGTIGQIFSSLHSYESGKSEQILLSKEEEQKLENFILDIRANKFENIQETLIEDDGLELLNRDILLDLNLDEEVELDKALVDDNSVILDSISSTLCLRPFQLAVVLGHKEVIEVILRHIIESFDAEGCISLLEEYLGHQARIIFPDPEKPYSFDKDDRSIDGMNVFHLAAKFYPDGISLIFGILNETNSTYTKILNLLHKKDRQLHRTPLHVALRNHPSSISEALTRTILDNAADPNELVNAKDFKHFTPLHYAAKSGSDINTKLILDYLSEDENQFYNEINAKGHRFKTPLHKARSPKVVKLLLDYGADEYLKIMEKEEGKNCNSSECKCYDKSTCEKGVYSVFNTLLHRNDKAAEVIFDKYISTNGQALDSSELLIVYDINIFNPNAKHQLAKHCAIPEDKLTVKDEMTMHSRIRHVNSKILTHPLSQVYLQLKWACVLKYFTFTVAQYVVFLLSLTGSTIYQTWIAGMNNTNMTECLMNSETDNCYLPNILANNTAKGGEDLSNHLIPFFCIYGLLAIHTAWLILRELFQMYFNWPHYSQNLEDKMEAAMIILASCYIIGVFAFILPILKHFAAWSVFFAWIEMILLIGRFSTVGKYVQMVFIVSKILIKYLMVYIPVVLAFSLSFYILLSENNPFLNPGNAFMKTMVMLLGELEYEGNFMWVTSDKASTYFPSTQILIMLFVLLGCIAIMNLLVGLAVDEIDVMREKGKEIRLSIAVEEIIRQEDLLVKKPTLLDYCTCLQKFIIQNHSLFHCLRAKCEGGNDQLRKHAFPTKICVRPIMPRVRENEYRKSKVSSFPVYFYYENRKRAFCRKGQQTGFELPENIVTETLDWLKMKNKDSDISVDIKKEFSQMSGKINTNTDRIILLKIRDDIDQILDKMNLMNQNNVDKNILE